MCLVLILLTVERLEGWARRFGDWALRDPFLASNDATMSRKEVPRGERSDASSSDTLTIVSKPPVPRDLESSDCPHILQHPLRLTVVDGLNFAN